MKKEYVTTQDRVYTLTSNEVKEAIVQYLENIGEVSMAFDDMEVDFDEKGAMLKITDKVERKQVETEKERIEKQRNK